MNVLFRRQSIWDNTDLDQWFWDWCINGNWECVKSKGPWFFMCCHRFLGVFWFHSKWFITFVWSVYSLDAIEYLNSSSFVYFSLLFDVVLFCFSSARKIGWLNAPAYANKTKSFQQVKWKKKYSDHPSGASKRPFSAQIYIFFTCIQA